jgi:hypothetical protein
MQLENIIALSMGIPTLLLAIYGVHVARRNKTGQSKLVESGDCNFILKSTC